MPAISRRAGSKARSKSGGPSSGGKRIARKTADLLISSGLLPNGVRAGAERVLEVVVKGVETALRNAKPVRVELTFTPRGKILVGGLRFSEVTDLNKFGPTKDDALAPAIKRGEATVAKILSRPDMLTGERFAQLVGMSRMAIHKRREKNEVLGLEGAKRGVRYPAWQLDDDGRPVSGLSELLPKFAGKPWAAYRFLLQPHAGLGAMTAMDALKAGKKKAVLEAADTFVSGDFS
jgi:hypothetical protein